MSLKLKEFTEAPMEQGKPEDPELASLPRPQEASSVKTAREAFEGFLSRLEQGDFHPYQKRLTEKEKMAVHKQLIQERGLRYAGCSFQNFQVSCGEQRSAMQIVQRYVTQLDERLIATNGGGLILIGPPGTGKDHLMMAAMTVAILDFGLSVVWRDGLRMYHRLKVAISKERTSQEIADHVRPQVLAISDPLPPKDELSTYEMACLRDIVDQRYSAGKSTWITTNVQSEEEAKQKLTGPILGRIGHNATEVFCSWPQFRKPTTNGT